VSEIVWLTSDLVQAIHAQQLKLFGGPPGLRDEGALESGLGRPINRAGYGEPDLA
jgi:death-on-curing protein